MKDGDKTKTQLIEELRSLRKEIENYKGTEEKINILSKMPSENPQPVLRVKKEGTVLYANKSSMILLQSWKSAVGKSLPLFLCRLILNISESSRFEVVEVEAGNCTFSLFIVPIADADCLNIYGIDITESKKKREELEQFNRLSVGRELKMIELKQKINELSAAKGISPPYKLDILDTDKNPVEIPDPPNRAMD